MERISYSPETLFHVLTHFETADEALRAGKNVFYIVGIAHKIAGRTASQRRTMIS